MSEPDFQPTLVGPNIAIRPISRDDWAELYAAASDPKIWEVHPVPTRYTEPEFRKFFDGAAASKMGFVFVDRGSGRLIGSSRFYDHKPEIGGVKRESLFSRAISGDMPYFIFEITKGRYESGGRALLA